MLDNVLERLIYYKDYMKQDLSELIAINSERDLYTKREKAPFGIGIRKCFDKMIEIAQREGFIVKDFDGYAMHIEYGKGSEILSILGHLDTVGIHDIEKWNSDPFKLVEKDGFWYGRGVNDNKGPMIGCLYVLKVLKELGYQPNKKIRIILGGAEETTWECMDHYFKYNEMPTYGFSPDGDFPIVNCEKGIGYYKYVGQKSENNDGLYNIISIKSNRDITRVCSRVEVCVKTRSQDKLIKLLPAKVKTFMKGNNITFIYEGISANARNPHKGDNALFKFVKDFKDIEGLDSRSQVLINFLNNYFVDSLYGEKIGLYHEDIETGKTTSNLSYVILDNKGYVISFDYRYPKGINYDTVINKLKDIGVKNDLKLFTIKHMPLHYLSPDNKLINALRAAYKTITGETPELLSKGASSYARTLTNGVAFGPTFPWDIANSHKPNENINIHNFIKALLIYAETIKLLC